MFPATQQALFTLEGSGPEEWTEEDLRQIIRRDLQAHLNAIGLLGNALPELIEADPKERIRLIHGNQRRAVQVREQVFVARYGWALLRQHFAAGADINPAAVDPVLVPVIARTQEADVFRLATLLWSVPVSNGYGRRMRYLVRDQANGKLIGLFGLTDPVYNLRDRDHWIGWAPEDRRQRLVNLMDAHVVGAVPPYSQLLGGKIVAALMTCQEVCEAFAAKYTHTRGIISQQEKQAQLVLLTVTSALGRSSLYNRLRLPDLVDFRRIGRTEGWGHFQVPDQLFSYMRRLLDLQGHRYAAGHRYGMGPNWRLRVVREALSQVGLDQNLLRHGIAREIYAAPMTLEWREILRGQVNATAIQRPTQNQIGTAAVARWLVPRAARDATYQTWQLEDTWAALTGVPPNAE